MRINLVCPIPVQHIIPAEPRRSLLVLKRCFSAVLASACREGFGHVLPVCSSVDRRIKFRDRSGPEQSHHSVRGGDFGRRIRYYGAWVGAPDATAGAFSAARFLPHSVPVAFCQSDHQNS